MLGDLAVWLFCDECLQYMSHNYASDYFKMLAGLSGRLIEFDLVNQIPVLANQVLDKANIIRQEGLLVQLVRFLVDVGLATKIHFSKELVVRTLDICV